MVTNSNFNEETRRELAEFSNLGQIVDTDLDPDMTSLIARIPVTAGHSSKSKYLAYRSTGFTVAQAAELCGIKKSTILQWRKTDPSFKKIEGEMLPQLQERLGSDVIRLEITRNLRVLLGKDFQLFMQFYRDPESLSEREWDYFKIVRKHYTASDLLAIEKILNPQSHKPNLQIKLVWGSGGIAEYEEPLDGEFKEITAS